MAESDELSISAFARRVGLTPSALRFYDDCGVLRPRRVDPATGYRYYAAGQEPRARLLAGLRRAALPLPEARVVLDAPGPEARDILESHLARTSATAAATRTAIERLLGDLPAPRPPRMRLDGPEFASAIRQVAPAALHGEGPPGSEVLRGVLVEIADGEVRVVATDRYRLSVRVLRPSATTGGPARIVVPVPDLRELAAWAVRSGEIALEIPEGALVLADGAEERRIAGIAGAFPDYTMVLDGLGAPRTRVITDRTALGAALEARAEAAYARLGGTPDELRIRADGHPDAALPAVQTGAPLDIAFAPAVLAAALSAGVGPDVLLEIASPVGPVVVRSADQGTFTTLAMPVRPRD
ncbi:MAG TPA: MerR family transcriptional regulator [Streptosporangiaceae bacterium]